MGEPVEWDALMELRRWKTKAEPEGWKNQDDATGPEGQGRAG